MEDKRFAAKDLTMGQMNAVVKKLGGYDAVMDILRGRFELIKESRSVNNPSDYIIRVDRFTKTGYPSWVKEVISPGFKAADSLKEYDLRNDIERWFHSESQGWGDRTEGDNLYKILVDTNTIVSCLNLQDGVEIQRKGISMFRELFREGGRYFLWGSVVKNHGGRLAVPYLSVNTDDVVILWRWLKESSWSSSDYALCFK